MSDRRTYREGDGDPLEWGRRLPNGQWLVHPPWGPTQIKQSPSMQPVRLPWWRRVLRWWRRHE